MILIQAGKGSSMKYKHIVFDIDGTLIDTEYAVLHSLQETIKGLSEREIPCSELRFALGITGTDALKKLEIKDTSYAIELWDKNMPQTVFVLEVLPQQTVLYLFFSINVLFFTVRAEHIYFANAGIDSI